MTPRSRFRPTPICLALVSTGLLVAAGMGALRSQPAAPAPAKLGSPLQAADDLDGIVQPRFQEDAGEFGVDRVVIGGHDDVYELNARSGADRSRLRRVKDARRPFVLAFLHCAHKPGKNVGSKRTDTLGKDFTPYLDVLAVGTKTQAGADKLHDWGETHLEGLTKPSLAQLKRGADAETTSGNWLVLMRPVRAARDSCLGCHAGDTLGVMVYAVDKNTNRAPLRTIQAGLD